MCSFLYFAHILSVKLYNPLPDVGVFYNGRQFKHTQMIKHLGTCTCYIVKLLKFYFWFICIPTSFENKWRCLIHSELSVWRLLSDYLFTWKFPHLHGIIVSLKTWFHFLFEVTSQLTIKRFGVCFIPT